MGLILDAAQAAEVIEDLIQCHALSIKPLLNRCKCGQVISDHRIACRACAMEALREARHGQS